MISYEEAKRLVFEKAKPLGIEFVVLDQAFQRILATDVVAPHSLPPFDNSAMDGYAIRSEDTREGKEVVLRVISEEAAGDFFSGEIRKGESIRIMTGAAMPAGADAVIPKEEVEERGEEIVVRRLIEEGENVRKSGEDIREGEIVLKKGAFLNSASLGLLAALGVVRLPVYLRPRVGIITTGCELKEIHEALTPGTIRDSNLYALQAQVISAGALPVCFGRVSDDLNETAEKLKKAIGICNVVLTTGGVSVGEYDLVKEAFEKSGAKKVFWQVAQKPAKPLAFYVYENNNQRVYLFGLPGNPAAVMISFEEYIRPLLHLLSGRSDFLPPEIEARLIHEFRKEKGRLNYLRVKLEFRNGEYLARSAGLQGSGILKSLVEAHGIALIPAEVEYLSAGSKIKVHLVKW